MKRKGKEGIEESICFKLFKQRTAPHTHTHATKQPRSCVSRFLKILDLSDNKLTEMNGEILQSYATNNVWIEAINVEGNSQVKAESLENIKS